MKRYAEYRASFNAETARSPQLSYVIVNREMDVDMTNLDRWYERYGQEEFGKFALFRLRVR